LRYIIGIGNYSMADDGIGLRIVEQIARNGLDRDFETIDLADEGLRLLFYLNAETERIVLIDAVDLGLRPGEYRLFKPEDVESTQEMKRLTTHESDILAILKFAQSLGYRLPPITILGIQPEDLSQGMELSPVLQRQLSTYLRVALEEVGKES
jgi:hydrogenase maturation protease